MYSINRFELWWLFSCAGHFEEFLDHLIGYILGYFLHEKTNTFKVRLSTFFFCSVTNVLSWLPCAKLFVLFDSQKLLATCSYSYLTPFPSDIHISNLFLFCVRISNYFQILFQAQFFVDLLKFLPPLAYLKANVLQHAV